MLLWICDLVTSGVVSAACLVAGGPQLPLDTLNLFMTSQEFGGSISPSSLVRFHLPHKQIPLLIKMVIGFFFFQLKVVRNSRRVVQTELVVAEAETLMLLRHALAVTLFFIFFLANIFFSPFGSVPVCSPQQQRVADQH